MRDNELSRSERVFASGPFDRRLPALCGLRNRLRGWGVPTPCQGRPVCGSPPPSFSGDFHLGMHRHSPPLTYSLIASGGTRQSKWQANSASMSACIQVHSVASPGPGSRRKSRSERTPALLWQMTRTRSRVKGRVFTSRPCMQPAPGGAGCRRGRQWVRRVPGLVAVG